MNAANALPEPARGPAVWGPSDVRDTSTWLMTLDSDQVRDLDAAVREVRQHGLGLADIDPASFPLPSWRALVAEVRRRLLEGRGFVMLRGVPVERYSEEECALAYWGIGSYFGTGVTQSGAADLLCEITDRGDLKHQLDRTYATALKTDFHCDSADIVGLLCIRRSKSGGASQISSAGMVFNTIRQERPDLLPILMEGFLWDRRNEHGEGESPVGPRIPVFSILKGRIHCRYARGYLRAAVKRLGLALSRAEEEAMDIVTEVARRPDVALSMDFMPGDIQLLNNYAVLHARTSYEDHSEPERRRLLLRLWLEDDAFRYINHSPLVRYATLRFGKVGLTARELQLLQEAR